MKTPKRIPGKIIYAIVFVLIVPAGLWLWMANAVNVVGYPPVESKSTGLILMAAGVILMTWAMAWLIVFGRGLPMNPYPPVKLVSGGPYRLFRHPIYLGFGILMSGYFIFTGSASGLWLVLPLTILGMIALVMGYEGPGLKTRFPDQVIQTFLDLPQKDASLSGLRDRLASLFWVVSSLLFSNSIIAYLAGNTPPLFGAPLNLIRDPESQYLPFLSFLFILIVPFILKRKDILREWVVTVLISLVILLFIALQFPEAGAQYLPLRGSALMMVPVSLIFLSLRALYRQSLLWATLFTVMASVLMIIQLAICRSASLQFAVSVFIFLVSASYMQLWMLLRSFTEKIANSWEEWIFGKVRVINHGVYTAMGTFFVLLVSGLLTGREYTLALMISSILLLTCAAIWAQVIEGSEKLKRPFGYYGAVVGLIFGSLVVYLMGLDVWVCLASVSVTMPWGQALGRLRCLVNGCCHGCRTDQKMVGIRYFHARSRVNNISGLKGELLHPTQLYSIVWLFFVGIFLFTLWNNHQSNSLIFGLYLILTSLGRFVEEAYRGEVQTPVIHGLRLYQWVAIVVALTGIVMTCIPAGPVAINPGLGWETFVYATFGGLFNFFAMGVDFPYSNVRFSKLV